MLRGGHLLGVAHFCAGEHGEDPEIAITVAHTDQHRGVASLLLEYLVAEAAAAGVARLTADVLTTDHDPLRVIADSGVPVARAVDGDVVHVVLHISKETGEEYVDAIVGREAAADVASLRPLLEPRSVVVVMPDGDDMLLWWAADGRTSPFVSKLLSAAGDTRSTHTFNAVLRRLDGMTAEPSDCGNPEVCGISASRAGDRTCLEPELQSPK